MVLGFIMAKRYSLSYERNKQVAKYLAMQREGRLDELAQEEKSELDSLKNSLS